MNSVSKRIPETLRKRKGFLPKHLLVEEEKLPLSRKHIGHAAADKEEHQEEGVG